MSPKQVIFGGMSIICVVVLLVCANNLVETVPKGFYHVKQAAVTGTLTVHKDPGLYWQGFGDITQFPNAETFYFTQDQDSDDDNDQDTSIEVRFNDGSMARISGTCRVSLPITVEDSKSLIAKHSYSSYESLVQKAILPVIREAARSSATLMSARESYSERRSDFVAMARDQAINGVYKTEPYSEKVKDPVSGELVTKTYNRIMRDESGKPIREENLLRTLMVGLSNFEIKSFQYEKRVLEQISRQQEAIMAVSTAKAQAQRAEQDALTKEAEGKAKVMEAKYQKEEEKIRAEVDAEKEKQVAVTAAEKEKDVAALAAEKAKLEAQRIETLADADFYEKEKQAAGRKALILADGALKQKIDAWVQAEQYRADALAKRAVPGVMFGGGGSNESVTDGGVTTLLQIMGAKAANDLGLQMGIGEGMASPVSNSKK